MTFWSDWNLTALETLTLGAERLEALDAAATPGPWESWGVDSGHSRYEMNRSVITAEHGDHICDMDGAERSYNEVVAKDDGGADAAFIAAMRGVAKPLAAWLRWPAMDTQWLHRSPQPVHPHALTLAREVIRATGGPS